MNTRKVTAFALIALVNQIALADASYQTTSQITGGTLVNQVKQSTAFLGNMSKQMFAPTNSLVMVHGNQKAEVKKDSIKIYDLDQGSITDIDTVKKTYTVMTFAQMRQAMAGMSKKMQDAQVEARAKSQAEMKQAQEDMKQRQDQMNQAGMKTSFDVAVKNTGVSKVVNGLTAQEQLITLSMRVTNANAAPTPTPAAVAYTVTTDAWIAPDPPEVKEIQDFDARMIKKMMEGIDMAAYAAQMKANSNTGMGGLLGSQPGAAEAMAQMAKEMEKLKGTHVLEVTSMGGAGTGSTAAGAAPAVPAAPAAAQGASAGQVAGQIATDTATQTAAQESGRFGVVGSALTNSVLGAFHRKKAAAAPAPAPAAVPAGAPTTVSVSLMEMTTQRTNFSHEAIPASVFQVPAGFKKVPSPLERMAQ